MPLFNYAILTEDNALALRGKEITDGSARILAATDKVAVFSSNQIKSQIVCFLLPRNPNIGTRVGK